MNDAGAQLASGETWRALCARIASLAELLHGDGMPDTPELRAVGTRYLTRFLAAGLRVCLEADDPDFPRFARMADVAMSWGLDNPDCNYSFARVRGDARYRISGTRGGARHIEFQVNTGHLGDGHAPGFGNSAEVAHALVPRRRRPALRPRRPLRDRALARPAGRKLAPPRRQRELRARASVLRRLGERAAGDLRDRARGRELPAAAALRAGPRAPLRDLVDLARRGRALLGSGQPSAALAVAALANAWWESLEFGTRQSSLNGHQAELDPDGVFRGVIAHRDPGVRNWLDPEGCERGTLAVRFLHADATPKPSLRVVKRDALEPLLHPRRRRVSPDERSAVLARRHVALQRRYGY